MLNGVEWSDISLKASTDATSFHIYFWPSSTHTHTHSQTHRHTHTHDLDSESIPRAARWHVFEFILLLFFGNDPRSTFTICILCLSSGRNRCCFCTAVIIGCCYWPNPQMYHGELLCLNTLLLLVPPPPRHRFVIVQKIADAFMCKWTVTV